MRPLALLIFLAPALGACPKPSTDGDTDVSDTDVSDTDDTDGQDTDVVGTELTGPSKIFDSCGPTDGPALVLSPAQTEDTCLTEPDGASTHPLRIELITNLPTPDALPHTITLAEDFRGGGVATYCPTPESCVVATAGEVTFTAYEHDAVAKGTYTVTLPDGQVLWGAFDASWCAVELWCG